MSYYLFARFSDMASLSKADFTFETDPQPHLTVLLRGGKTDTRHRGFLRYVSANADHPDYCPVQGPIFIELFYVYCTELEHSLACM